MRRKYNVLVIGAMILSMSSCGVTTNNIEDDIIDASSQTFENAEQIKVNEDTLSFEEILGIKMNGYAVVDRYLDDIRKYMESSRENGNNESLVYSRVLSCAYYVNEKNVGARVYELEITNVSKDFNDADLKKGDIVKVVVAGNISGGKAADNQNSVRVTQIILKNEEDLENIINSNTQKIKIGSDDYYRIYLNDSNLYVIDTDTDGALFLKEGEEYAMNIKKRTDLVKLGQDYWWYYYYAPLNEDDKLLSPQGSITDGIRVYIGKQIIDLIESEQKRD